MKSLIFACVSFAFLISVIFAGGTQNNVRCYECSGYYMQDCADPFDNRTMMLTAKCAQCSKGSVQVDGKMYIERRCLQLKSDDGCQRNATNWECLCSDVDGCNGRNTLVPGGTAFSMEASVSVVVLSAFLSIQQFVLQ
ncbi:uncharacterized protein LOC128212022 [Mya arenaria]|uniref:uncharacterized protein LOC128212022 n=1 Tax=Mya arenaria TaxID=6604 RepID=UPI0022E7C4DD|nr:uncharacterized protein LOC128212022 [Mya arenaria]